MTLKFCDIPLPVWQAVRDKWAAVLENGWDEDTTWDRCAMCDFIDGLDPDNWHECGICPLNTAWCGGVSWLFRPQYMNNIKKWEQNVARFIRMCDKIIENNSNLSNCGREEVIS